MIHFICKRCIRSTIDTWLDWKQQNAMFAMLLFSLKDCLWNWNQKMKLVLIVLFRFIELWTWYVYIFWVLQFSLFATELINDWVACAGNIFFPFYFQNEHTYLRKIKDLKLEINWQLDLSYVVFTMLIRTESRKRKIEKIEAYFNRKVKCVNIEWRKVHCILLSIQPNKYLNDKNDYWMKMQFDWFHHFEIARVLLNEIYLAL